MSTIENLDHAIRLTTAIKAAEARMAEAGKATDEAEMVYKTEAWATGSSPYDAPDVIKVAMAAGNMIAAHVKVCARCRAILEQDPNQKDPDVFFRKVHSQRRAEAMP